MARLAQLDQTRKYVIDKKRISNEAELHRLNSDNFFHLDDDDSVIGSCEDSAQKQNDGE